MINQKQNNKINNYYFIKICGMIYGIKKKYMIYYLKYINGLLKGFKRKIIMGIYRKMENNKLKYRLRIILKK